MATSAVTDEDNRFLPRCNSRRQGRSDLLQIYGQSIILVSAIQAKLVGYRAAVPDYREPERLDNRRDGGAISLREVKVRRVVGTIRCNNSDWNMP